MNTEWSNEQNDLFSAFVKTQEAHTSGDADTFKDYVAQHSYHFGVNQGLLMEQSNGVVVKRIKAGRKAGMRMSWEVRHPEVFVYGAARDFGVVACYVVGFIKMPDDVVESGVWRSTSIWLNEEGNWRAVHTHTSPMKAAVCLEPSSDGARRPRVPTGSYGDWE